MIYTKRETIRINVKGDIRNAEVVEKYEKGEKIRVKLKGSPFFMSIKIQEVI